MRVANLEPGIGRNTPVDRQRPVQLLGILARPKTALLLRSRWYGHGPRRVGLGLSVVRVGPQRYRQVSLSVDYRRAYDEQE